jgi:predicted dehydrogenase
MRFHGERGVLHLDRYAPRLEVARTRMDIGAVRRQRLPRIWTPGLWQVRKLARPAYEPSYRRSLGAFVEALQGGTPELPSLDDGLRSLEVVVAAETAARTGEQVALASLGRS